MGESFKIQAALDAGLKVRELAALLNCDRKTVWEWRNKKNPPRRAEIILGLILEICEKAGTEKAIKQIRAKGLTLLLLPSKKN